MVKARVYKVTNSSGKKKLVVTALTPQYPSPHQTCLLADSRNSLMCATSHKSCGGLGFFFGITAASKRQDGLVRYCPAQWHSISNSKRNRLCANTAAPGQNRLQYFKVYVSWPIGDKQAWPHRISSSSLATPCCNRNMGLPSEGMWRKWELVSMSIFDSWGSSCSINLECR